MLATLRLFKAVPIKSAKNLRVDKDLNRATVQRGFVFSAEVIGNNSNWDALVNMVDGLYGRDPYQLNQAFHKSFSKVRDASLFQLYVEQVLHYLTTYGAETMGVYDSNNVYIPMEQLAVPGITAETKLIVIRGLTLKQIKEKTLQLLSSGVALSKQTIEDVMEVAALVGFSLKDIEEVRNKEVKVGLYDHLGLVPENPTEFLRYVIFKVTGSTLLIKSKAVHKQLQEGVVKHKLSPLFLRYKRENGLDRLAEIFYRFKPLFLALRTDKQMRPMINQIRRLAVTKHKPMPVDFLNTVTALVKNDDLVNKKLVESLKTASIFRKIRLAQALRIRTIPNLDSIVYRVRNGKSFATGFVNAQHDDYQKALGTVLKSIVADLKPHLKGKKVFIPENFVYGLPATEKQFTGNLPSGTYIQIPNDMVVGVYWEDQDGYRVDLDLSMISADGKFGWDRMYRDTNNEIYFSGDMTSAPKGASEFFHVGKNARGTWILNVNYFNFSKEHPVPMKIVVGSEPRSSMNKNYILDPNNMVGFSRSVIDVNQKMLGVIVADGNVRRFYFYETNMGGGRSAGNRPHNEQARRFTYALATNPVTLNDVLASAGVKFVDSPEDADIDLSPEVVDQTTLINLLSKPALALA